MESGWSLHGELGFAIAARDVAKRKLWQIDAGVQRRLRLFSGRIRINWFFFRGEALFVFRRQDLRSREIVVRINVFGALGLRSPCALLARGLGHVLRFLRAAMRRAEKQARAEHDCESAAQRLSQRHLRVQVMLAGTTEGSIHRFRPTSRGTFDAGILPEGVLRANGNFLGKRY
jgi:hypothetical protein